jgi:L-amino acid N-acyltransferase YncA
MSDFFLRPVRETDAAAITRIYAPIVEQTTISFEEIAPSSDECAWRIREVTRDYPWFVACDGERVVGYAYGTRWRKRTAYRYSVEVTVYVDAEFHGKGVAGALYSALFLELQRRGFHRAFAGVALPNDASIALHQRCGFEPVGTYKEAGRKFGRWVDVAWLQRAVASSLP